MFIRVVVKRRRRIQDRSEASDTFGEECMPVSAFGVKMVYKITSKRRGRCSDIDSPGSLGPNVV